MSSETGRITEKVMLRLGQVWRTADGDKAVMLSALSQGRVEGIHLKANRIGSIRYRSHNQFRLLFPVLVFDPEPDIMTSSALRLRWAHVGSRTLNLLRDLSGAKGRLATLNCNEMIGRHVIDIVETSRTPGRYG